MRSEVEQISDIDSFITKRIACIQALKGLGRTSYYDFSLAFIPPADGQLDFFVTRMSKIGVNCEIRRCPLGYRDIIYTW